MGYRNREIEVKLLTKGETSLSRVKRVVESWVTSMYPEFDYIIGNAADLYWYAPDNGKGDFVRLRRNNSGAQITMKSTDKEDITNRIEIDLEVEDYRQAKVLMEGLFGDPVARIKKKYHVYFLENDDTTVSVYQIAEDKRVFVEIEARGLKRVKELTQQLLTFAPQYEFCWLKSSVYDMFVEKTGMISEPIAKFLYEKELS